MVYILLSCDISIDTVNVWLNEIDFLRLHSPDNDEHLETQHPLRLASPLYELMVGILFKAASSYFLKLNIFYFSEIV
jgi:hypothetical protein